MEEGVVEISTTLARGCREETMDNLREKEPADEDPYKSCGGDTKFAGD